MMMSEFIFYYFEREKSNIVMRMYMSHNQRNTLGRKNRVECTKLTRFKKNLQASLACRTGQPVVIYLNCPAATACLPLAC